MKLFLFFLILSIVTHAIRTIYEILKTRNKIKLQNKIIFIIIATDMFVLWISWFYLCLTDPVKITLSPVFRHLGAGIFILGVILFIGSFAKIKKFGNSNEELITNGIYRFLRHPMYLSFVFWMVGSSLFNQSAVACLMTIIFTVNIFIWGKLEEIRLQKIFPGYKEYIRRTYF